MEKLYGWLIMFDSSVSFQNYCVDEWDNDFQIFCCRAYGKISHNYMILAKFSMKDKFHRFILNRYIHHTKHKTKMLERAKIT